MTTSNPPEKNRRRFVRFPAMCRVDYEVAGRQTFGFTGEISSGGLFLKNAKKLDIGATIVCALALDDGADAVEARCTVRRVTPSGTGLEFVRGQTKLIERVRRYIDSRLASRLEERVKAGPKDAQKALELAGYYCECGRHEDAVEMYRVMLAQHPEDQRLFEDFAVFILDRVSELGPNGWPWMADLERVVSRGLALGSSEKLKAIETQIREIKSGIERRSQEERRAERRVIIEEAEARLASEIAAVTEQKIAELRTTYETEINSLRSHLAQATEQNRELLAAVEHELEEARKELKAQEQLLAETTREVDAQKVQYEAEFRQRLTELNEREKAINLQNEIVADFEANLKNRQAQLGAAQNELAQKQAAFASEQEDLAQRRKNLEDEELAFESKLEAQREKEAELEARFNELKLQAQKIDGEQATLNEAKQSLERALADLDTFKRNLETQNVALKEAQATLQHEQAQRDFERHHLDSRKQAIDEGETELATQRALLHEAKELLSKRELEFEDRAGRHTNELNEKLAQTKSFEQELGERSAHIEALKAKLDEDAQAAQVRQSELEARSAQIEAASQKLAEEAATATARKEELLLREKVASAKELTQQNKEKALIGRQTEIEQKIEEHAKKAADLLKRELALSQKLQTQADQEQELSKLRSTIKTIEDRSQNWRVSLEKTLSEKNAQIEQHQSQFEAVNVKLAEAEKELAMAARAKADLENRLSLKELEAESVEVRAGELDAGLERREQALKAAILEVKRQTGDLIRERELINAERQSLASRRAEFLEQQREFEKKQSQPAYGVQGPILGAKPGFGARLRQLFAKKEASIELSAESLGASPFEDDTSPVSNSPQEKEVPEALLERYLGHVDKPVEPEDQPVVSAGQSVEQALLQAADQADTTAAKSKESGHSLEGESFAQESTMAIRLAIPVEAVPPQASTDASGESASTSFESEVTTRMFVSPPKNLGRIILDSLGANCSRFKLWLGQTPGFFWTLVGIGLVFILTVAGLMLAVFFSESEKPKNQIVVPRVIDAPSTSFKPVFPSKSSIIPNSYRDINQIAAPPAKLQPENVQPAESESEQAEPLRQKTRIKKTRRKAVDSLFDQVPESSESP